MSRSTIPWHCPFNTLVTASCGSTTSLNNTYFMSRSTIPWYCPLNSLVTASCGSTSSLNNTYFMSRSTIPWYCPLNSLVTASCGSTTSLNNTYFKSRSTDISPCTFTVCRQLLLFIFWYIILENIFIKELSHRMDLAVDDMHSQF
jgi:hypothetical protein